MFFLAHRIRRLPAGPSEHRRGRGVWWLRQHLPSRRGDWETTGRDCGGAARIGAEVGRWPSATAPGDPCCPWRRADERAGARHRVLPAKLQKHPEQGRRKPPAIKYLHFQLTFHAQIGYGAAHAHAPRGTDTGRFPKTISSSSARRSPIIRRRVARPGRSRGVKGGTWAIRGSRTVARGGQRSHEETA
jgi:hypothetical protein